MRSDRATIEAMAAATYGRLSGRLAGQFLGVAESTDWPWPEPRLTYENALPVRALIAAGRHHGSPAMVDAGLRALDWLVRIQTHPDGHFSPIGNDAWLERTSWRPVLALLCHFSFAPVPEFGSRYRRHAGDR